MYKNPISEKEIIEFLQKNIEPLKNGDYGAGYRASMYLTDGTFLPCVMFQNSSRIINLAKKRFKDEIKGRGILGRDGYN
ncbi:MAG: hypothetical protein FWE13_05590 [Firmicutes bacterium]|nr:hypothetical protein [Bacillota bacterium]